MHALHTPQNNRAAYKPIWLVCGVESLPIVSSAGELIYSELLGKLHVHLFARRTESIDDFRSDETVDKSTLNIRDQKSLSTHYEALEVQHFCLVEVCRWNIELFVRMQ